MKRLRLPAVLAVSIAGSVTAALGLVASCESSNPPKDAAMGSCELYCIPNGTDAGVCPSPAQCADAGTTGPICPAGCEPIG